MSPRTANQIGRERENRMEVGAIYRFTGSTVELNDRHVSST